MFGKTEYDDNAMRANIMVLQLKIKSLTEDLKSKMLDESDQIKILLQSSNYSHANIKATNYVGLDNRLYVLNTLITYCDNLSKGVLANPLKVKNCDKITIESLATLIYCKDYFVFKNIPNIEDLLKKKFTKKIINKIYQKKNIKDNIKNKLNGEIDDNTVLQLIIFLHNKYNILWDEKKYSAYMNYENSSIKGTTKTNIIIKNLKLLKKKLTIKKKKKSDIDNYEELVKQLKED
jgi:hypothetical protein